MERIFSKAKWEKDFSYCRALKTGPFIYHTGTVALTDSGSLYSTDVSEQTKRVLELLEANLKKLGANRSNIVRTRIFITNQANAEQVGKVHGAFFSAHPPCTSMLVVKQLINDDFLVEIEADAILEQ